MKLKKIIFLFLIFTFNQYLFAQSQNDNPNQDDPSLHPRIVQIMPSYVFVPTGFDDNDNVEIVVEGKLKNTCQKFYRAQGFIENNQLILQVMIKEFFGKKCLNIESDFVETINIGIVPQGIFDVTVETDDGLIKVNTLTVTRAKSSQPDDFLYVPVESVQYKAIGDGKRSLILSGTFSDSCMELAQVQMYYENNVLVVLPLLSHAKLISQDKNCLDILRPFQYEVPVTTGLNIGKNLIHVRSLNGKSVNQVITVGRD